MKTFLLGGNGKGTASIKPLSSVSPIGGLVGGDLLPVDPPLQLDPPEVGPDPAEWVEWSDREGEGNPDAGLLPIELGGEWQFSPRRTVELRRQLEVLTTPDELLELELIAELVERHESTGDG